MKYTLWESVSESLMNVYEGFFIIFNPPSSSHKLVVFVCEPAASLQTVLHFLTENEHFSPLPNKFV